MYVCTLFTVQNYDEEFGVTGIEKLVVESKPTSHSVNMRDTTSRLNQILFTI